MAQCLISCRRLAAVLLILIVAQQSPGLAVLCLETHKLNAGVCDSPQVSFPLRTGEDDNHCMLPPLLLCYRPDVLEIANGQKITASRDI